MKCSKFQARLKSTVINTVIIITAFLILNTQTEATGVRDKTFGTNGRAEINIGGSASATGTIVQPDGKIIVFGDSKFQPTGSDIVLARFNSNGSVDTSFGNGGKVISEISQQDDRISEAALQPDGKIVVVGHTYPSSGISDQKFLVVRYNSNGTLDTTFGNGGIVTLNQGSNDVLSDVAIQTDGKIVAVGRTSDAGGKAVVLRLNSNGTLDSGFGNGGFAFPNLITGIGFRAVVLLPNQQILAGGFGENNSNNAFLTLFDNQGQLAQSFGDNGLVRRSGAVVFDLAVQPDGKIIIAGSQNVRYFSDGTIDSSFKINSAQDDASQNISLLPNGRFITNTTRNIRLYNSNNTIIGKANGAVFISDVTLQSDGKIIAAESSGGFFYVERIQTITSLGTRLMDFNGDEKTEYAVVRPSNNTFYLLRSTEARPSDITILTPTTPIGTIIPEDYFNGASVTRDFTSDLMFWRPESQLGRFSYITDYAGNTNSIQWGLSSDIPVGGDYDGDGYTDFTVFRPSDGTWYIIQSSNNQFRTVKWGQAGDKPVPADYDYDGITDVAIYRPSTGVWWVLRSSDFTYTAVQFGISEDKPVQADYDGDGRADFAVYRPSNGVWYLLKSTEGFAAAGFGLSSDAPVPGDYDGDGLTDIAVFRPEDGNWYLLQSKNGFNVVHFGQNGDVPLSTAYAANN